MQDNFVDMVKMEKRIITDDSNNIFFIESNNALVKFHPRLLCAFESAANHNPNKKVTIFPILMLHNLGQLILITNISLTIRILMIICFFNRSSY